VGVRPLLTWAEPTEGRKIEVLVLGNEGEIHAFEKTTAQVAPDLAKEGINWFYSTSPMDLNSQNLAKFDAVLLYAKYDSIAPAQETALLNFVNSGKGFLAVHSAAESFPKSPAYVRLVGGELDHHSAGAFTASIVRSEHPVTLGGRPFIKTDKTFVHKNLASDRVVLMERTEGTRQEPVTWVRNQGKGRVFYTAYGHDEKTWKRPEFLALMHNAILLDGRRCGACRMGEPRDAGRDPPFEQLRS